MQSLLTILLVNLGMLLTGNLCAEHSGIYRRKRLAIKSRRNWLGKFDALLKTELPQD